MPELKAANGTVSPSPSADRDTHGVAFGSPCFAYHIVRFPNGSFSVSLLNVYGQLIQLCLDGRMAIILSSARRPESKKRKSLIVFSPV